MSRSPIADGDKENIFNYSIPSLKTPAKEILHCKDQAKNEIPTRKDETKEMSNQKDQAKEQRRRSLPSISKSLNTDEDKENTMDSKILALKSPTNRMPQAKEKPLYKDQASNIKFSDLIVSPGRDFRELSNNQDKKPIPPSKYEDLLAAETGHVSNVGCSLVHW